MNISTVKRIHLALAAILVGFAPLLTLAANNPRGNHFFAYSIKDTVVQWLDPKPITHQKRDPDAVDFKGYLPEGR